jgi:hypothetical protein
MRAGKEARKNGAAGRVGMAKALKLNDKIRVAIWIYLDLSPPIWIYERLIWI